jgi:glycerol-3-phosphate acyltransferase PlsX
MAIILDAMGSDSYPSPELEAAVLVRRTMGEELILVGKQELLEARFKELFPAEKPLHIVDAPDIVEMTDKPVESARKKPNNSMAVGLNMVKNGEAEAFVTAGNTGAAFFNAVNILRRMEHISRPALAAILPVEHAKAIFMDTGANADCRPEFLLEFAIMGSVYAEKALGINSPRVALLSNGEEAGKGSQLVKDAFPLLANSGLNFYGNAEPKEVYAAKVDVVVTDGFSGNVFIKTSEAVGKLLLNSLKEGISSKFIYQLGYLLAKPAFSSLRKMLDPAEVGAAILLGVDGLVFIGHGKSDAPALVSAVKLARRTADAGLLDAMKAEIESKRAR